MSSSVWAASKVDVEKKGTYIYWFTYKDTAGKDQVTMPEKFKGKTINIDPKKFGAKFTAAKLHVMNKRDGSLAIVDYAAPKDAKSAKPLEVSDEDFQYVPKVQLKVVAEDGSPVESAVVSITDGDGTAMQSVVTPADMGIATFEDVATGEIGVKVQTKGIKKTVDSEIEIPDKRKDPVFTHDVKVSGDVETLSVSESDNNGSKADSSAKAEKKPSGGSSILQYFTGILFVVIVIAIIVAVIKSKGLTTSDLLKKVGAELPSDSNNQQASNASAQPAEPAVDPNKCPFCGQIKDANGNCACTVTPGASPFEPQSQGASGGPRLIGSQGTYSGYIFELTSPSMVIGREEGNDIALPNDSTTSRRHAVITKSGESYSIQDQGSSNGTYVNGAKITQQTLAPGDEVQIGATKFRFEV